MARLGRGFPASTKLRRPTRVFISLAGVAAGTSTTTGDLIVQHPLATTSTGVATATASLAVARPLQAATAGVSTASGSLTNVRPLAGSSAGVATAVATASLVEGDNFLLPRLDVATNSWTDAVGGTTNLYASISESIANDLTYIQSPLLPLTSQYYEAALETRPDPLSSVSHIGHYRYQKTGTAPMNLTFRLYQGSTQIASWAHTNIGTSWTTQNQTLTGPQADSITDYSDLRVRLIPEQTGSSSSTERIAPDALTTQTNLTGSLANIQDDPNSPDANWLVATGNNVTTTTHVTFGTPTAGLTAGAGLQEFRIQVRKNSLSGTGVPGVQIHLYENGSLISSGGVEDVTSTTGQVLVYAWDGTGRDAALIECRVVGVATGGSPAVRASVDVGAVEWGAAITVPTRILVSWANFEIPQVLQIDGRSDGAGTASADLDLNVALGGTTAGASTASSTFTLVRPLAGSAAGVSTASASPTAALSLAATAAGTSTSSAAAKAALALAGSAAGVSTTTGIFAVTLGGSSAGSSTAAAALGIKYAVTGSTAGVSTASASLRVAKTLIGTATGVSATPSMPVLVNYAITASAAGTATASGAITRVHGLSGGAASVSTTSATATRNQPLAGTSAGVSTASASTKAAFSLAGTSAGSSTTSAVPYSIKYLTTTGIPSQEAFGTPAVRSVIRPAGISSAESFGTSKLDFRIMPTGIASAEVFGVPVLAALIIRADGIPSGEVFGAPTIILGAAVFSPPGIPSVESVGTPTISLPGWWNSALPYRRRVVVTTGVDVPALHPVVLRFTAAGTIDQGKIRPDFADLELIKSPNIRLPREVERIGNMIEVRFLLNEPLASGATDDYYVYYGNSTASDLGRPSFVDNPWPVHVAGGSGAIDYSRPAEHWKNGISRVPGARAAFEFHGTSVRLVVDRAPSNAIVEMQVDDGDWERVDLFSRLAQLGVEVYRKEGLNPTAHRVRLRAVGKANPNASGRNVNVVRFDYVGSVFAADMGEEVFLFSVSHAIAGASAGVSTVSGMLD